MTVDGAEAHDRKGYVLLPGEGRHYSMGGMSAIFKADGAETNATYNISEWWLEPNTQGPPAHAHPEDDVFFVIAGTMHFLLEEEWFEAPVGTFVLVPGGVTHTFENRSGARAGALNIGAPGGFEEQMPKLVEWFARNPPGPARGEQS